MRKILIITPYAGRTGSEMMMGYLLRHYDRSKFEIAICALQNGELLRDLPEDVRGFVAPNRFNLVQKIQYKFGENPIFKYLRNVQNTFQADVWYINTLVPAFLVPLAKELGVQIVTHFHELPLEYAILKGDEFKNLIHQSDRLIGCSEIVCQHLREAGGTRIELCHSLIDHSKIKFNTERIAQLRVELDIKPNEFVWVASGQSTYRKGFDMLPEFSEQLKGSNCRIIWVGQLLDDGLVSYTLERLKKSTGIRVDTPGVQREDYYAYLSLANGFLLTSREDPFPLVMIEAAALGKPIFSFASGGVKEFVLPGIGEVVDSWNVKDLVAQMKQAPQNQYDTNLARKRAQQFDVLRVIPRWQEIMLAD
ncbi:MAG: glycosyltransferase [Siphonobacter sp.]